MPSRIRIAKQLWGVCVFKKPWAVLPPDFFSFLPLRLSSLVRLTTRWPCGCWACSGSFKLVVEGLSWYYPWKGPFEIPEIFFESRKMEEDPMVSWGRQNPQEVSDWRHWVFSRWLSLTWRNHRRQEILGCDEKIQWINLRIRFLPFQLILECLPDIFGSKTSSSNLLANWIEETLDSSKCFVELGLDLVFLPESESSQCCHKVSRTWAHFQRPFALRSASISTLHEALVEVVRGAIVTPTRLTLRAVVW